LFRIILFFIFFGTLLYINLKEEIFNSKTLYLGASLPQTGIMKAWGSAVYSGANAYFSYVNENNLLNGKEIKLITYDDKYEPELTKDNIQTLIEKNNIFAFFGFVGTPTVKNVLPILEKENIPFVAAFTGASFLRNHKNDHFINLRSSYAEEIENLVQYLHEKKGVTRIAVFYQNDNYGEEGFVSLLSSLKKHNLTLAGEGTYKRNTLSIRHAFNEIKEAKPQAVILVGAYKANALFIKTAKNSENFNNTLFCNVSFGDADEMIKELNYETHNLLFSQVVPSYNDDSIHVILEYKRMMRRYYPDQPLSFISLESFLAAKTVVKALQQIKGNITQQRFLDQIKKLPSEFLSGLTLNYKNTQLLNKVYIFKYENSKFVDVNREQ
jgi:ABC-type branched-subunit amino acid transport system substrate-binding protein